MPQMQWSMSKIKQCEALCGQAILSDESSLVSFSTDFGHFFQQQAIAVTIPETTEQLQKMVSFAHQHQLPITIRANGLSQQGQALPIAGSLLIITLKLNKVLSVEQGAIWAQANCSWSDVIAATLPQQVPYVLPYNCNLSVAGILSAGGIGASSFKFGPVVANISALELIDAQGSLRTVDNKDPLFHACLGGQGRFAVISKVKIDLRPSKPQVRTFFLFYLEQDRWQKDMYGLKEKVDYIEFFCTPAIQGAKLNGEGKRSPFAQWFYVLQVTIEYDKTPPEWDEIGKDCQPWQVSHTQDEALSAFLHRHDGRFQIMQISGQWDMQHPWYECFLSADALFDALPEILTSLPLHYATVVQIVPIKPQAQQGSLMFPKTKDVCSFMILNAGLPAPLIPSCLSAIESLDNRFLPLGGKRYLSGYLGNKIDKSYWKNHFGERYEQWVENKKQFDPQGIFCSLLFDA